MSTETAERKPRHFLVVVDETPECRKALRFAARRAHSGEDGGGAAAPGDWGAHLTVLQGAAG